MRRTLKKFVLFSLVIYQCAFANFGDLSLGWSDIQSADFQDYAIRSLNKQNALINHFETHFWLEQKIIELNLNAKPSIDSVIPIVLKDRSINAFAIPGNIIGIHRGLMDFADDENELLSVLAHEMAHIQLDHFARITNTRSEQNATIIAGILLAILLAQQSPEAANAALFSTLATITQRSLNFSQSMELEADKAAEHILTKAGKPIGAGSRFFRKLDQASHTQAALEFLRTHPLGVTRSARLASQPVAPQERAELSEYDVLRWQLGLDTERRTEGFFQQWKHVNEVPNNPALQLAWLGWHQKNSDQLTEATQQLAVLNEIYSGHTPLHFRYLIALKKGESSLFCEELYDFEKKIIEKVLTVDVLRLMAQDSTQCNMPNAAYWQAKLLWQSGQETRAMAYLENQMSKADNANTLARLKEQLKTYTQRYERFL